MTGSGKPDKIIENAMAETAVFIRATPEQAKDMRPEALIPELSGCAWSRQDKVLIIQKELA